MTLHIDKSSAIPIGEQIQSQLRLLIQSGELEPGDLLPTVHSLADELEVNYNTVAAAYRTLEAEGYLVQRRRAGTRVSSSPPLRENDALAAHLASTVAATLLGSGLAVDELLKLIHAQAHLRLSQPPLKIAVVAYTPFQAATLAERIRPYLGKHVTCIPQTLGEYRSVDHHVTLIDPDLLVSLRHSYSRASPPPLTDASPWTYGADFPAGAD
jgi:GntR family transcriptional regulator